MDFKGSEQLSVKKEQVRQTTKHVNNFCIFIDNVFMKSFAQHVLIDDV
jgi:hypothetical protein